MNRYKACHNFKEIIPRKKTDMVLGRHIFTKIGEDFTLFINKI